MRGRTLPFALAISCSILCAAATARLDPPHFVKPNCKFPAPLEGSYQPTAPGYIVQLRGDTNSVVLGARTLAKMYGFKLHSVFESTGAFYTSSISQSALAKLRCESQVQLVEYNSITTAN
jgi:hypothetical protein